MQIKTIAIMALAVITAGTFTACKNTGKGAPDSTDTLSAMHTDTSVQMKHDVAREQRDSVQMAADMQKFDMDEQVQVDKNTSDIARIKQKMANANTKMKARYNASVIRLQADNEKMKERLHRDRMESAEKWQDFKTGFKRDMDNLGDSIKAASRDNDN